MCVICLVPHGSWSCRWTNPVEFQILQETPSIPISGAPKCCPANNCGEYRCDELSIWYPYLCGLAINSAINSYQGIVPRIVIGLDNIILSLLLNGYFEAENLGVAMSSGPEAEQDRRAEEILRRSTVKRNDSHYEIGLLWRQDSFELLIYDMAERP